MGGVLCKRGGDRKATCLRAQRRSGVALDPKLGVVLSTLPPTMLPACLQPGCLPEHAGNSIYFIPTHLSD